MTFLSVHLGVCMIYMYMQYHYCPLAVCYKHSFQAKLLFIHVQIPCILFSSPPLTGSVISLKLEDDDKGLVGVKCTPSCLTRKCYSFGNCDAIDHQFEIVLPDKPNARKIKSGATVALRSKSNPTKWLDCNNTDKCSISRCTMNNTDSGNGSYVTSCDSHYFKIFGVRRREGRLLNSNHSIQLRHKHNNSYLNCNKKKCTLLKGEDCPNTCEAQSFKLNILR